MWRLALYIRSLTSHSNIPCWHKVTVPHIVAIDLHQLHIKVHNDGFRSATRIFTARKRSLRRLCFHRFLGKEFASGPGGSATHPQADTPLGSACLDTCPLSSACWDTQPLPNACWDTPPAQCMLGYGQQAGGTHPTGMHSCSV